MKKINRRGFTLIELLASMVILGMIMAIAIPNVMGILNNSRNKTYVQDAKKLLSLAEYKFRSDSSIIRPSVGNCTVLTLGYLDNSEFDNSPNGNGYVGHGSYVVIKNEGTATTASYVYYVNLMENPEPNTSSYVSTGKGISLKTLDELNNSEAKELVLTNVGLNLNTAANQPVSNADGSYGSYDGVNSSEVSCSFERSLDGKLSYYGHK